MDNYGTQVRRLVLGLNKISGNHHEVERALVMLCLRQNGVNSVRNKAVSKFIAGVPNGIVESVGKLCASLNLKVDENLIVDVFEHFIPTIEKRENGTVFTPLTVKNLIISEAFEMKGELSKGATICDPACGSGSFLVTLAATLHKRQKYSYSHIFQKMLFGVELLPYNVFRAKILLSLAAIIDGEDLPEFHFNLAVGNALALDWKHVFPHLRDTGGFDFVIGNPPYVRSKNMSRSVRQSLRKWKTAGVGNPDLYIPFFELGIDSLRAGGILGYITTNSYLHSLNGRAIREYLSTHSYRMKVYNFEANQMFDQVMSYTCVTMIGKEVSPNIEYTELKGVEDFARAPRTVIPYAELSDKTGWMLAPKDILYNLRKIESKGVPLGKAYPIRNGIATLNNDLYIFRPSAINGSYYTREYQGKQYSIEKDICREIIKPNILRTDSDLQTCMQAIIFPYREESGKYHLLPEAELSAKYPRAYSFLKKYRSILALRDKGHKTYPAWYAFGRTQGFNVTGKKLLIPYMAGEPVAIECHDPNLLFYCGYAILISDDTELKLVKKIIKSKIFWYYIKNSSKHYSNGYMSFAKSYIERFSIPSLSAGQRKAILNSNGQESVDRILQQAYSLKLPSIKNKSPRQPKLSECLK